MSERGEKLLRDLEDALDSTRTHSEWYRLLTAYNEEIEAPLKARVAELEADLAQARADYQDLGALMAEDVAVKRIKDLEAEVERLRSLDDETSCPASERAGYEGLIAAMTEEIGEWRAKAEANAAELDRAWKQVAILHDLLAAAWAAADPDVIADYAREGIEAELDETKCVDYCAIYDKARAAAHALEVIERERLNLLLDDEDDIPAVVYPAHVEIDKPKRCGNGPTIIEAVADYEQRKAKGGE